MLPLGSIPNSQSFILMLVTSFVLPFLLLVVNSLRFERWSFFPVPCVLLSSGLRKTTLNLYLVIFGGISSTGLIFTPVVVTRELGSWGCREEQCLVKTAEQQLFLLGLAFPVSCSLDCMTISADAKSNVKHVTGEHQRGW